MALMIPLGKMIPLVFLTGILVEATDGEFGQPIPFNNTMATIVIITKFAEQTIMMYLQLTVEYKCPKLRLLFSGW